MSTRAFGDLNAVSTLERAGFLALATATVYVAATLLGSVFDPTYSQIRQHIGRTVPLGP